MPFTSLLITIIGTCAIGWYFICLFYLGFIHPQPGADVDETFRQFMATSITTISGTMATYVGMILGIKSAVSDPKASPAARVLHARTGPITWIQAIAAIAYVASLVIALFAWWKSFPKPDPTIVALGKSLLGLIGGVLAVILNVNVRPSGPVVADDRGS
jgi:hypothetical protein